LRSSAIASHHQLSNVIVTCRFGKWRLSADIYSNTGLYYSLFVQLYQTFFKNISKTNIASLLMCSVSMVIIYSFQRWINPRVKQKLRMPVPIELIVVSLLLKQRFA
jgi:MFS superfamily sulfate permease-like transporter